MKKISIDIWNLILLVIISLFVVLPLYAHYGSLIFDCGREVYYPAKILQGKVLYKDLFCIYGPFSYMFNAVLFKIFGINLNVLYLSGVVSGILIVDIIYLIARKFLPRLVSFSVAFFTVSIGFLSINLFNFVFPYSYSMLYGLLFFFISLLFIIKYAQEPEKYKYLYVSLFFAGVCISNKYDFLLYPLALIYIIYKNKPYNLKNYLSMSFSFLFIPALCLIILFLQGLKFDNIFYLIESLHQMSKSPALKYFYSNSGVFISPNLILFIVFKFLWVCIPLLLIFLLSKYSERVWYKIFAPMYILAISFTLSFSSFIFLPLFITIWFIVDFKNIRKNDALVVLVLGAILASLKVYFGLIIHNYGTYYISVLLIAALALVFNKFKDKKYNLSFFAYYVLAFALFCGLIVIVDFNQKQSIITTPKGKVYTNEAMALSTNKLISFIQNNTKNTDRIAIFPEGLMINFLVNRPSEDYYNSLLPIYVDAFGEEKLIKHFQKQMPEYIVFSNIDMHKDYYFKNICSDYAFGFCSFVAKNYIYRKEIDFGFRYLIYEKK